MPTRKRYRRRSPTALSLTPYFSSSRAKRERDITKAIASWRAQFVLEVLKSEYPELTWSLGAAHENRLALMLLNFHRASPSLRSLVYGPWGERDAAQILTTLLDVPWQEKHGWDWQSAILKRCLDL